MIQFHDVTNLEIDLEMLSESLRRIYQSFIDFGLLPATDVEEVLAQPYLFSFLVWREHAECFADALHALTRASSPKRGHGTRRSVS